MDFSNVLKSSRKVTLKEAGMKHIQTLMHGRHILYDTETKNYEIWYSNKNHASFGLIYKNTHLEFGGTVHAVKYTEMGKEKQRFFMNKDEAYLEAYQLARNSNVFVDDEQVYTNYKY